MSQRQPPGYGQPPGQAPAGYPPGYPPPGIPELGQQPVSRKGSGGRVALIVAGSLLALVAFVIVLAVRVSSRKERRAEVTAAIAAQRRIGAQQEAQRQATQAAEVAAQQRAQETPAQRPQPTQAPARQQGHIRRYTCPGGEVPTAGRAGCMCSDAVFQNLCDCPFAPCSPRFTIEGSTCIFQCP
jgi:hypothetical protein